MHFLAGFAVGVIAAGGAAFLYHGRLIAELGRGVEVAEAFVREKDKEFVPWLAAREKVAAADLGARWAKAKARLRL
jgi:hypothetical protein